METVLSSRASERLEEGIASLRKHYASASHPHPGAPLDAEIRYAVDPGKLHCQLFWTNTGSPYGDEFLWDVFNVALTEEQDATRILAQLGAIIPVSDTDVSQRVRRLAKDVSLFKYHPIRYRALVPYAKQVANMGMHGEGHTALVLENMQAIQTLNQELILRAAVDSPLRPRVELGDQRAYTIDPVTVGLHFADFNHGGRQIFDLPRELVDLFALTDVDELPFDSLKLPYRSFYIHFGRREELETEPGWHADGAYVSMIEGKEGPLVQMLLTSVPDDPTWAALPCSYPEPVYTQTLLSDQLKMSLGVATEMDFGGKIKQCQDEMQNGMPLYVRSGFQDQYPPGAQLVDVTARNAAARLKVLTRRFEVWKKALRLVVNGIAYVTHYPDDIETRWPEGTPPALLRKVLEGNKKEKQRARSELAQLGFTEIRVGGRDLREKPDVIGVTEPTHEGRTVWVAGKWFHQAHGPKWQLRRWWWRRPHKRTLSTGSPDDEPGHIYKLDS